MSIPQVNAADRDEDAKAADEQSLRPKLEASEARFRNVIEANADGMVVVFTDGVIAFANPAATTLLGRRAHDLVAGLRHSPRRRRNNRGPCPSRGHAVARR